MIKFSEEYRDIWQAYNAGNFIVITTNGFVKRNGEAVMGAGIARQAKDKFLGLAYAVGQAIAKYGNVPLVNLKYRLITLPTKKIWTEDGNLELIEDGLKILVKIVDELEIEKLYLPRPGCGNGKRSWENDVRPICEKVLNSRFVICHH
jgi:hypothetical protein